ncbi:hypothetical protein Q73A0000_09135 [Kaistella flava (ex Peng et al. 2021)]|uniref:Uncharacterized protein n=1 Tax=Kaistella flava (ex Peng et al. 2021) TaxID=2038776 RepID=A0A7M2Y8P8_9FLAO|nr:hypothetical protein [Kaistella flava (ex Peng et al. 2021)]QOW10521.1 hypothetical protein Q73A0000_09135 [Kaistella flava (ex Peng et al. 2021)]
MFYLFFLLAVLLSFGLLLSVIKTGRFSIWAKAFRMIIVGISIVVFTYYFIQKSVDHFLENSLTVQVVNKLPFPVDFYIIKVNDDSDPDLKYETRHLGIIRNNYYRIDYLKMDSSDQYWIAAYMGKKNLVYFSQHSVPNKNEDQIIEVQNYIVQSSKLADIAKTHIEELKFENIKTAIWMTLGLLLVFLNLALLLRKAK